MPRILSKAFAATMLLCALAMAATLPLILAHMTPVAYTTAATYNAFGAMATMPNGHIVWISREGTGHVSGGVSVVRFSADGGTSWTPYPGPIFGPGAAGCTNPGCFYRDLTTDCDGAPCETDNQNVGCSATACVVFINIDNGGTCCGTNAGVLVSRTTDNGISWSTPTLIPNFYVPTNSNMVIVPSGSGSSACPTGCMANPILKADLTGHLLISTDDGITWPTSKPITGLSSTEEIGLAWLSGDQIFGMRRYDNSPPVFFYSSDFGTTWTTTTTNIAVSAIAGCPTVSFYTFVSPWLLNLNRVDGKWVVWLMERQVNSCGAFGILRAVTFVPATVIASPTSFTQGQVVVTRLVRSQVSIGYPAAVNISNSGMLVQYNDEDPAFNVKEYLFTAQYTCQGSYVCMSGGTKFSSGAQMQ